MFHKTNRGTLAVDVPKSNQEHQRKAKPRFSNTAEGRQTYMNGHKPSECTAVTSLEKSEGILMTKKLWFNCSGPYHRSA